MKSGGLLYIIGAILILAGTLVPFGGGNALSTGGWIYYALFVFVLLCVINAFMGIRGLAITTLVLSIIFFLLYAIVVVVIGMLSSAAGAVIDTAASVSTDAATQKAVAEAKAQVGAGMATLWIPTLLVLVGIIFDFIGSLMGMKKK